MYNNGYNYNPYINQMPRYQNIEQPIQNNMPTTNVINRPLLNGKVVESLEVVKAIDIPIDGSISYFPIADGSCIVTKQLQLDGTSKTVIFKPIEEQNTEIRYITREDMEKALNDLDFSDLDDIKDEIKDLKQEIKDLRKKKSD